MSEGNLFEALLPGGCGKALYVGRQASQRIQEIRHAVPGIEVTVLRAFYDGPADSTGRHGGNVAGTLEHAPLEDSSLDLAVLEGLIAEDLDAGRTLSQTHRLLGDQGSLLLIEVAAENLPEAIKGDVSAWLGCAGELPGEQELLGTVRTAGFKDVEVVSRHEHIWRSCCHPVEVSTVWIKGRK